MKLLIHNLRINNFIILALGFILFTSCGPREYKKIPLEDLDPKMKKTGSLAVKDIITSLNHEDGAMYLLHKDYMTPMVHARIMKNSDMYNETYQVATMIIGNVIQYQLFEVVDKGIIKTMRYKLVTDADDLEFVELKVDINNTYGLADYYLYVTSKDGLLKRKNLLPAAIK